MSICRRNGGVTFLPICLATITCGIVRSDAQPPAAPDADFTISTTSFQAGGDIPARFTCSGANVSPALTWTDPPAGTQSFALIVEDPDAPGGVFTHWVLYDLPPSLRQLGEGVPQQADPEGGHPGRNGFDNLGYGGPCPPPGHPHRYYFKLYALDTKLNLPAGASKAAVEKALKGHVLTQTEVMGRFKR